MSWREFLKGKKVTVMGLGLLGRGIGDVKFLSKYCDEVIVTDLKDEKALEASIKEISDLNNIKLVLGEHKTEDFENRDFVLKAAGVPLDSIFIKHAKDHEVPVFMDESLFAKLAPNVEIVGVTGTRGKTTVTMMIEKILRDGLSDRRIMLGGNLRGVATLPLLENVSGGEIIVMELSSWQLQGFGDAGISPHVSVFTNFMDDHLNYYGGDRDLYFKDKSYIFTNQTEKDFLVYGTDMQEKFLEKINEAKSKKIQSDNDFKINLRIPGQHNVYNAALAYEVGKIYEIPEENIRKSLEEFSGAPGRVEFLREVGGVYFYNDTNATTPDAAAKAIKALKDKGEVILIAGGADKNLSLEPLISEIENVKDVVLLSGTGTDRLKNHLDKEYKEYPELSSAFSFAKSLASPGDIVLLSPGFASFGMFKNEYDRGDQFNELVKSL